MSTPLLATAADARGRLMLAALCALGLHGAVLLVALQVAPAPVAPPLLVTEVELSPEEPPPPPPEPAQEEPAQPPAAVAQPRPSARPPRAQPRADAKAAGPSAAAPLHTAREDAPSPQEPVRFTVDAQGASYGFGVVARGGSAQGQGGVPGGSGPAPAASAPSGDGSAALRSFAVPPRLDESDPCRGYFPAAASSDWGSVTLRLLVSKTGDVQRAQVLHEEPKGQGFGKAALLCLGKKRFVPALAESGLPQPAEAPVTVRFRR